jgi:oligopeptide/dipeptide ABC transporter, ATP-binding protein, C-terminal domain
VEKNSALTINNLSVSFKMYNKTLGQGELRVIHNLGLTLNSGEILAIAGSSGSGKSLLAHAVLGILPRNATVRGEMTWFGEPLTQKLQKKLRGSELALVPQSVEYLDPLMRVGKQVEGVRNSEAEAKSVLTKYGLSENTSRLFPFQLSGGMARRVLVSTAVIGGAKVIIADEPTPGLSPELAETAMGHFRELADAGAAVLLITHDLDLALRYADRIAVFYAGMTVESSLAADWVNGEDCLRHPYSRALWRAMPQNGFVPTAGVQPYAGKLPVGCLFADRCELASKHCSEAAPKLREFRGGEVCCHNAT